VLLALKDILPVNEIIIKLLDDPSSSYADDAQISSDLVAKQIALTNLLVQRTVPANLESLKDCFVFTLAGQVISQKKWHCKYLMRLILITLKEACKRNPSRAVDFLADTVKLLQQIIDAHPWEKAPESAWHNLRQGLVIFFANYKKEDSVRDLFNRLLP